MALVWVSNCGAPWLHAKRRRDVAGDQWEGIRHLSRKSPTTRRRPIDPTVFGGWTCWLGVQDVKWSMLCIAGLVAPGAACQVTYVRLLRLQTVDCLVTSHPSCPLL